MVTPAGPTSTLGWGGRWARATGGRDEHPQGPGSRGRPARHALGLLGGQPAGQSLIAPQDTGVLNGVPGRLQVGVTVGPVRLELEDALQEALDQAVAEDELLSLQSLSSTFPASSRRAGLAYAQSNQVVTYLIETYGQVKMGELLAILSTGTTYDQALQSAYGLSVMELDNEWRGSLGLPPQQTAARPTPVVQATIVPYGAGTATPTRPTAWPPGT